MSDGFFFLGILLFFFVLWAATGGPTRPISFAGPYITPISSPSSKQTAYGDQIQGSLSVGGATIGIGGHGTSVLANSTYSSSINMDHYVSGTYSSNPNQEYIRIHISNDAPRGVDITGWKLKSTVTGLIATIPSGVQVLRAGQINTLQDVVLHPGDEAIVSTGISPIGASFAENECSGYLSQFQRFTPELSSACPDPSDDLNQYAPALSNSNNVCSSYVQQVGRCTVPSNLPQQISGPCTQFVLTFLTYNGCVAAHGDDVNFLKGSWRIYLNRNSRLWKDKGEQIELIDTSGKIVDSFTY